MAIPAIGKIRYRPVWLMICPARIDEPKIAEHQRHEQQPELLADAPLAIWRNVGRYVTAPNMHDADEEQDHGRQRDGADPEEAERHGRLDCRALHEDERTAEDAA